MGTLTTGFDATHVDVIAVLRATESASLFQQIVGRGLRLHEGKVDVLVLDYAENIERHQLGGDVFDPTIKTTVCESGEKIKVQCPLCLNINEFTERPNKDGYEYTNDGHFADIMGRVIELDKQKLPSHFGRRCNHYHGLGREEDRCNYRWSSKECPGCGADNDVAARYCEKCKEELIDPNEKLARDFQRVKVDSSIVSTDKILEWSAVPWKAKSGRDTIRLNIETEYASFSKWYWPERGTDWRLLCNALFGGIAANIDDFMSMKDSCAPLKTVTAYKPKGSDYYNVLALNQPVDKL